MADANFAASHPLFLRSGNGVPVSLYRTNVTLCPDKKGPGHQAPRSPSEVPVPAKEKAELSGRPAQDQGLRPCPAAIPEGARRPAPSHPSGCPVGRGQAPSTQPSLRLPSWQGPGLEVCVSCYSVRAGDGGESRCHLKAWAWLGGGLGEGPGAYSLGPPAHLWA